MDTLASVKNPQIAGMRALKDKKARSETGRFLVEGRVMILEALACGLQADILIMTEEDKALAEGIARAGGRAYLAPERVIEAVCETRTPQGACAVFTYPKQLNASAPALHRLVALDGVQDPGNCGTIWRCADAAGFDGLLFGDGSADALSPKVQRAAMGSGFRLPARFHETLPEILPALRARGFRVVISALSGDDLYAQSFRRDEKTVLVVGNEARGVSDSVMALADIKVKIPMRGGAESLNAAVAAGILMYEMTRP